MTPDPEPKPESQAPQPPPASPPVGRGQRSGRGRRGRGRRRSQAPAQPPPPASADGAEAIQPVGEHATVERAASAAHTRKPQPAPPAAVEQTIEQVNQIVETLRQTLADMEEVLETVELAERQKNADEQEIEMLRRSLRQLTRPREGGPHSPRH